jgi:hypothetical protein
MMRVVAVSKHSRGVTVFTKSHVPERQKQNAQACAVLGSDAEEEGGDRRGGNHHVKNVRGRKLSVEAIRGVTEEER